MKLFHFLLLFILLPVFMLAQENTAELNNAGKLEIGMRTTISTFSNTGNIGTGFGGQFRLQLGKRINTEWFADFFAEDVDGLAKRNDDHIGWSVMIYPLNTNNNFLNPYIIAGNCFDYTKISTVNTNNINYLPQSESRLSSATQIGIGTHLNMSKIFNVSFSAQYMIHLGNEVNADINYVNGNKTIHIYKESGGVVSLEGHLLFTVSVNYKIADLW